MEHEVAHAGLSTLISPTFNLSLLLGILFYFLKTPLSAFIADRHTRIKTDVADVAVKLAKAKEKYEEFSAKLNAIEAEVRVLREQAKQEADQFRVNVLTEAKKQAAAIVVDAKNSSGVAVHEFRRQVLKSLSLQVISKVEKDLLSQLTGQDKKRIRQELVSEVNAGRAGGV